MMLSNEALPVRNPGDMPRVYQWRSACTSKQRVKASKSFESHGMTDRKLNGSRTSDHHPSGVNGRGDSTIFDGVHYRCASTRENDRSTDVSCEPCATLRENDRHVSAISDHEISPHSGCDECAKERQNVDERFTSNFSEHYANRGTTTTCEKSVGDNVRWRRCPMRNVCCLGEHSWRALVALILVVSVHGIQAEQRNQCALGIDTPGVTWPRGDIVLEYGQPLRILCMLSMEYTREKFPGKNASDLVFFHNKKELEPEYVKILNETTIALYVEEPPPAEDMYYCKLRLNETEDIGVCLNKVAIGFKPQEPQNFSCVSHNWENVICTWDPVPNYVTTKFDLLFKLPGRAGGRKLYPCPRESQKNLAPNTCLWDTSTNPIYRQPYEYYTFVLNVTNFLGLVSISYKFHHFAHVIPAKPANLSVVNKTLDSTLLHWSVPFPMQNFPPGLHHRVTYQHQWDHRKTWRVINITSDPHAEKRHFNLTGLEHANAKYDVRVFIKSALAIGEDKWSQFSNVTFRTPPRLPGLSPRTDIGSFEIAENIANRDVYLYWQSIPAYLENGDHFKYQIAHVEENGRRLHLLPNETTRTYAKFKGISFNSFRFEVATVNVLGANRERSNIFVPSRLEMPPEPLAFTKIAFDGGLYELSWKPPMMADDITNYTIFWCDNERDRPWQCTGYLDWVHVSRNTTLHNVTVPNPTKVYQFAISANTPKASSGMVWASCTVIHNKVVGKMKSVWINRIGSDFIEVGWKLECSDRIGVVEGFNIYYCPIVSPYNLNCRGPKLNTTIRANHAPIHGIVNGLKPYTTYMLAVAVLTKNGEGLHSDPLYNTTLEAAPKTPPINVRVTNITNSSMFVSWNSPSAMNGVLRFYEINYNGKSQKVDEVDHVTLRGLLPHKNYSISVAACTVSCSVTSSPVYGVTSIGRPGKISKIPNVRFMNSSQVMVRWEAPRNPGGFLDYYQIWSADGEIRNSTRTEALLPIPDCKTVGRERMYQFRVRAVNVALDGTHLEGPWSDTGEGNCYSDGPSFRVWVVIWIISSLSAVAFIFCVAYTAKRMWLKCKAMQDVEVKLPPGLTPNMKLLQKVGEQHIRQSSADSSGCSSGQESVTSSLTSDSHVSSDSGADVDPPVNPTANKLLETAPSWEASNLRQRNVGATRPVGTSVESPRWDSYVKVAKSGEPMLDDTHSLARSTPNLTDSTGGYTASPHAWSSTGYISMPSSEELSSNPSPVPKDTTTTTTPTTTTTTTIQPVVGGYSVVGVVPKPVALRPKTDEPKTATNPYVSLASLEQKTKNKTKAIEPSCDLDDLAFVEKTENSSLSKPYVQTSGLLDALNKQSFAGISSLDTPKQSTLMANTLTADSSTKKPFVASFPNTSGSKPKSIESASMTKPYVAVGWMPELATKAPPTASRTIDSPKQKFNRAATSTEATKPYVTAAGLRAFERREKSDESPIVRDIDQPDVKNFSPGYSLWQNDETMPNDEIESPTDKLTSKRTPSYVTVGENPRIEQQRSPANNSGYVQHQRFEKQLPAQPQRAGSASATTDERYSKVSVAPNTLQ